MGSDKRKEIRSLVTQQPHGKLHVLLGDQTIDVYKIKDLSQSGMRLQTAQHVPVNKHIILSFHTKTVVLKLHAAVMWSSGFDLVSEDGNETNSCFIGLKLTSPSLLETLW